MRSIIKKKSTSAKTAPTTKTKATIPLDLLAATPKGQLYPTARPNPEAKEFEVNNWVISDFIVNHLVPVVGCHPFPLSELQLMTATVVRFRPTLIVDWGTHIGKSARIFYEAAKAFGVDATVHTFDLRDDEEHVEHPHEQRGIMVRGLAGVTMYQEDGVTGALRIAKQNKIAAKDMLFFIDGDHSYESVTRELNAVIKNHPEAKVLLHDTFFQSRDSKYNIGPWKAIQEFLQKHKSYRSLSTNTGLPGMTLVYKAK